MSHLSRRQKEREMRAAGRLPDGQSLTEKFPVLTYGPTPKFNPADLGPARLRRRRAREGAGPGTSSLQLPTGTMTVDIHCVTRWSKFDTAWEGVMFRDFLRELELSDEARFVIAHCDYGYTTNLPLDVMDDEDVMLAYKYEGRFLHEPELMEHGGPLRTVVPKRYFWKSAKFLRALEFSPVDKPGFWEQGGYHNDGDFWKQERFQRRGYFLGRGFGRFFHVNF